MLGYISEIAEVLVIVLLVVQNILLHKRVQKIEQKLKD